MGMISIWKNKFLSNSGKEVLLESSVMNLPNYSMLCYNLSNPFVNRLEKGWPITGGRKRRRRRRFIGQNRRS